MRIDEIEDRKAEIKSIISSEGEFDVDALTAEVRSLNEEKAEIEARNAKEAELRSAVEPAVVNEIKKKEERKMDIEVRNSKEYISAYANYIKTGDDKECRALLNENASSGGTVAVPELVYEAVKHAWEDEGIMALVNKTYVKGNLKVGFEQSAGSASIHAQGDNAPNEESLSLGIVTLAPETIMKWVSVSAEIMDMDDGSFLNYIYGEVAHQIAKKAADQLVSKIGSCTTTGSSTSPIVPEVTAASIALGTVASAIANLSDEATKPVVMMNKLTYAAFKAAQYAANYPVDPFEGCQVLFNSTITAFSAASTGDVYAIVGDLGYGAMANFPNGGMTIKVDDTTLATSDLVRVIGREPVAVGVVAPKAFVKIKK